MSIHGCKETLEKQLSKKFREQTGWPSITDISGDQTIVVAISLERSRGSKKHQVDQTCQKSLGSTRCQKLHTPKEAACLGRTMIATRNHYHGTQRMNLRHGKIQFMYTSTLLQVWNNQNKDYMILLITQIMILPIIKILIIPKVITIITTYRCCQVVDSSLFKKCQVYAVFWTSVCKCDLVVGSMINPRQRERQNIVNRLHAWYSSWYMIGSDKFLDSVHVLMYVQQSQVWTS